MTGDTMHTDEQIERAARLAEAGEPTGPVETTMDLRKIADAADEVKAGNARIAELVTVARANGRSWGQIGLALGVSRQAARERFSEKVSA